MTQQKNACGREEAVARLDTFVDGLVGSGRFSAVSALVGVDDQALWTREVGVAGPRSAPATARTRYDLASLTKPFTAALALALDRGGRLPLETELGEVFDGVDTRLARCPLEGLLRHRSRLEAWAPLYGLCRRRRDVPSLLLGGSLLGARLGTYSDLGFVVFGLVVEAALGRPFDRVLRETVLDPLGLLRTVPSPGAVADVAASPLDGRREVELAAALGLMVRLAGPPRRGQVQDGNARFLGGIAGHAGLFSTSRDVWGLAREWLHPGRVLDRTQVRRALGGTGEYALGWARRRLRGSAGPALGARAFGHLGFTGGSVWSDPATRYVYVLLGHRTSVDVERVAMVREFHRLGREVSGS